MKHSSPDLKMEFQVVGQPGTKIKRKKLTEGNIQQQWIVLANQLLVHTATGPSIIINGTLGNTAEPSGMA
jgi:hypothetical protein